MSDNLDRGARSDWAASPLAGLVPSRLRVESESSVARHIEAREQRDHSRMARNILSTMPVLLVGSLALASLNLGGTTEAAPKRPQDPKSDTSDLTTAVRDAVASAGASVKPVVVAQPTVAALTTASTPTNYTVKSGDTVSGIAGRYGLSTASVLALNGLSWKSLIFPGQVLKLTKAVAAPAPTPAPSKPTTTPTTSAPTTTTSTPASYTVKSGDTVSGIAARYHLSTAAVLALNGLNAKSIIFPGQVLKLTGTAVASTPPAPPVTAPPVTAPPTTTPTSTSSTKYTIKSGDTVTSIAKKYGVTVTAILQANGLSASSIIYAGRTLIIPATTTSTAPATTAPGSTGTQPAQVGATITPLSPAMKVNALTIIAVGKQLNVPSYGIIIALAAAAQESGLINLSGGDRDSVGLFQQRPSTGWGTPAQIENTTYASELFYGGPSNPNKGKTRGLLDIPNWQSMTVTQAAQAVEISAYPDAYAKWQASATAWLAQLG
jgi:LysM repeat protein